MVPWVAVRQSTLMRTGDGEVIVLRNIITIIGRIMPTKETMIMVGECMEARDTGNLLPRRGGLSVDPLWVRQARLTSI